MLPRSALLLLWFGFSAHAQSVSFSLQVETKKAPAKFARTDDAILISFVVNGSLTPYEVFFKGAELGSVKSKNFTMPACPTGLQLHISKNNAWGFNKFTLTREDGAVCIIAEDPEGNKNTYFRSDNSSDLGVFWLDSDQKFVPTQGYSLASCPCISTTTATTTSTFPVFDSSSGSSGSSASLMSSLASLNTATSQGTFASSASSGSKSSGDSLASGSSGSFMLIWQWLILLGLCLFCLLCCGAVAACMGGGKKKTKKKRPTNAATNAVLAPIAPAAVVEEVVISNETAPLIASTTSTASVATYMQSFPIPATNNTMLMPASPQTVQAFPTNQMPLQAFPTNQMPYAQIAYAAPAQATYAF